MYRAKRSPIGATEMDIESNQGGNGATEMEIESNQGSTNGEDGEAPSQQNGVHPWIKNLSEIVQAILYDANTLGSIM